MDEWNIPLALVLLIAILLPPQTIMGANGFMKSWDAHIERPAKRLPPPKLIRLRYNIRKAQINIITYLSFLAEFVDWLMCIVLLPCVLFLEGRALNIALLVFFILFWTINLPIGILRTACCLKIAKKQKSKLNTEEYVVARSLAETLMRSFKQRKVMREYKYRVEIIDPFLREFEQCLDKKNGVQYISDDNWKWAIDRIIPKYQKHLSYSISSEPSQDRLLTIHLKRNKQMILQIPIKKFNKKS